MAPVLADASSFLGSLWFAGLALLAGYLAGNIVPLRVLNGWMPWSRK